MGASHTKRTGAPTRWTHSRQLLLLGLGGYLILAALLIWSTQLQPRVLYSLANDTRSYTLPPARLHRLQGPHNVRDLPVLEMRSDIAFFVGDAGKWIRSDAFAQLQQTRCALYPHSERCSQLQLNLDWDRNLARERLEKQLGLIPLPARIGFMLNDIIVEPKMLPGMRPQLRATALYGHLVENPQDCPTAAARIGWKNVPGTTVKELMRGLLRLTRAPAKYAAPSGEPPDDSSDEPCWILERHPTRNAQTSPHLRQARI